MMKSGHGKKGVPLRDWSCPSYSASNGRPASSLANYDGTGSPSTTHAPDVSAQIPTAFSNIDKTRTQSSVPVRKRPFTQVTE